MVIDNFFIIISNAVSFIMLIIGLTAYIEIKNLLQDSKITKFLIIIMFLISLTLTGLITSVFIKKYLF